MNERLKKLVRQADACYIPRYDMWQMDTETLEKFAELIVRECLGLTDGHGNIRPEDVQKHFGVE